MKKYLLIGLFTFVSCAPLLAAAGSTMGGGNTCAPRTIKCPDGRSVVSHTCGNEEQARKASCHHNNPMHDAVAALAATAH